MKIALPLTENKGMNTVQQKYKVWKYPKTHILSLLGSK